MRCQHCSLALWFLGTVALPSQAKNIMRRSQAHIASDGAILQQILDFASSETDSAMPVYKLYFNLQGKHMCWQRESEGCRSSAAECNVEYCHADDPGCDCMKVGFRNCSESRLAPLQLFVETMKQPDGNFPDHTYYWRQLRVKYYDSSEWGDRSHDFGKALESYLACNTEPCKCRSESIFRFAWDGSRLVNVEEETRRSVGPSPFHVKTGDTTLTLREYNMRLKESKMEAEASHTYHDPTSSSTKTTSTTTGMHSVSTTRTPARATSTSTTTTTRRPRTTTAVTTSASDDIEDSAEEDSTTEISITTGAGNWDEDEEEDPEEEQEDDSGEQRDRPVVTTSAMLTTTQQSKQTSTQQGTSREPQPPSSTSPAGPGSGGNTGDARSGDGDDEDGGDGDDGSDGNSDDDGGDSTDSSDGAGEDDRDDVGSDDESGGDGETAKSRTSATSTTTAAPEIVTTSKSTSTTATTTSTSTMTSTTTSLTRTTTTTTTQFCHCFANVSWRKETPGRLPSSPSGSARLRRTVATAAVTAAVGGCKKFCLQDGFMHAIARQKGSDAYCTCYTKDTSNPVYDTTTRFEENQSLIGEWNLEAPAAVRGYTKLLVPKTSSEKIKAHAGCPEDSSDCSALFGLGCGDKPPLLCPNTHEHSPFVTTLPPNVRPSDSFFLSQACTGASVSNGSESHTSLCSNAWVVYDLEEKFTVTKIRFHNYVTQDAVRKVIFSGSSNVGDWVPAQAIDLPNTATERSPSAEKHSVSEHVLDVPISERFLKMEILENYGSRGVGFFRIEFHGFRYFFTDFTRYPGKACGGYELEDMKGLGGSEQRCRAQCAARLDCAAVEVVHSGASAGSCIFHSNIWIPTRSLEDERDCFVREGQTVFCQRGLPLHDVCCSPECGTCGGDKCSYRPGGRSKCCAGSIRVMRHLCANTTDVACRIPRPRRAGVPTLRLTFENETGGSNASEDLRPSKTIKVSGFQPSTTLSRAGGTAADLTGVNTGIEIRNYGRWFTATSTYMCWIRPTFVRDQTWYFIFRSSGYTMHNPEDGSWAVEFQCKGDKARLMIWTRQPAGLGAVSTEFKAKARWADRWTHVAVVMRVGGAFPQLYLNGLPEEVEDSSAPWSELEDIVYNENQYLIIGKAAETDQQFDGFIDHFEIYEESLTPQFMRKHYNTIESAKDEGEEATIIRQICLPPTDTTGYIIQGGSAARNSFDVSASCDDAMGYGGMAVVTRCSMTSKRYALSGCLLKEQCSADRCLVKS